jgi:hypothetical protein
VLLGSLAACGGDDDDGDDRDDGASAGPVVNEDHWHAAFGVYVCDEFLPAMPEFESPDGIHTHGDGVIHIHPFTADAAGENATVGLFLEGAGIEVSDGELGAGADTYTEGEDDCGGEEAEVVVARWADVRADDSEPERVDTDAHFRGDGEGYVVAFVPEGTAIPVPESAAELDALVAVDGGTGGASTTTSPTTTATASTASPVEPDGRALADGFYPVEQAEPAPCRTPGMREIVDDAEASLATAGGGGWQVGLALTEAGLDAFNDIAARCYQRDATCPLGQVALVVDDEVVFAPTIQEPSFERDQIVVSGDFTEVEARNLARSLAG